MCVVKAAGLLCLVLRGFRVCCASAGALHTPCWTQSVLVASAFPLNAVIASQAERERVLTSRGDGAGVAEPQRVDPKPSPSRWLRMARKNVDFDAAFQKARAKDPSVDPWKKIEDEFAGGAAPVVVEEEEATWRDNLPSWLPVEKLQPGQHLQRLHERLDEVEALLAAHARAVALEQDSVERAPEEIA